MNPTLLLALASIHIAAVMAPGANFLTVTQNALAYSRRTGLLTVAGVVTGSSLYVIAGVIGFAAVLSQSPLLYDLIRVVGAAYFSYMGYQLLTRKPRLSAEPSAPVATTDLTRRSAYLKGLATALANPASALYFLSIFATFIPVDSTLVEKLVAGVLLLAITLTWYALVATFFHDARVRSLYRRAEVWMNRLFGVMWLLLAVKLLAG